MITHIAGYIIRPTLLVELGQPRYMPVGAARATIDTLYIFIKNLYTARREPATLRPASWHAGLRSFARDGRLRCHRSAIPRG